MAYYYLVASLPDLNRDNPLPTERAEEVLDTIYSNLEPDDRRHFQFLLYPNDNRNLMHTLLAKRQSLPEINHLRPSVFSQDDLEQYTARPYELAPYMASFLSDFSDRLDELDLSRLENELFRYYFQAIEEPFIKAYATFQSNLNNYLVWLNAENYGFVNRQEHVLDIADSEQIQAGNFSAYLPSADDIREALQEQSPYRLEQELDALRWDFIEQETGLHSFDRVAVYGYVAKLLITYRWQALEEIEHKQTPENIAAAIIHDAWHQKTEHI